jgi:formylglycine-generating enzyme required for sulfatase activity
MAGNVHEWTVTAYEAPAKEMADRQQHCGDSANGEWTVVKGGAAISPPADVELKAYFRTPMPGGCRIPYVGFRCVQNVENNSQ